MKLLSIRLHNVRRFTDPVEITGFGPGVNVLSAPNEQGKSTVFDALHAVFFEDRKSWKQEIKSLVPHAGGTPCVDVEFEDSGHIFRLEKSWTSGRKGSVRILRDGLLYKQEDDAEAWLQERLKSPKDGGPAGLLWVRQGLIELEDKKGDTLDARRDLLSSVTGEVEAMTGGRQMDTIRAECKQALAQFVTGTGRPKAGGPLKSAEETVESLDLQKSELSLKAKALRDDLDRRNSLRRERQDLEDPLEAASRKERLATATAAHDAASRHATALERAMETEASARIKVEAHERRVEILEAQLKESTDADALMVEAEVTFAETTDRLQVASATLSEARTKQTGAQSRADTAAHQLRAALAAQAALNATERRTELKKRLEDAEAHRTAAETLEVAARSGLDPKTLEQIERLWMKVTLARNARDSEAAAITMTYLGGRAHGLQMDGAPVPGGERLPLPDGAMLEIDGIGQLQIHPGQLGEDTSVETAEAKFFEALEAEGMGDLDMARQSARERSDTEARLRDANAALKAVAPDGIEALRERLAALPKSLETAEDLPTVPAAEEEDSAARQTLAGINAALESARTTADGAQQAEIRAAEALENARGRVDRARLALNDHEDPRALCDYLTTEIATLRQALQSATDLRANLAQDAPDLEAAEAGFQRAQSAVDAAEQSLQRIARDLAALDARIAMHAAEAVDEELADVTARLEGAEGALEALRFEVAVLQRLDAALEEARASARDRYVEPVLTELAPLVRMLWPEAELQFDADTLLPSGLVRAGTEEDFGVLSGGTQEQIALLVRLAFARILAKAGNPAPLILDDAIVYTDDDRIEKMFDALTRQANDLQIIVFSCRQKAFRGLGGQTLSIAAASEATQ